MGTNYYWNPELVLQIFNISDVDMDDPKIHIGKSSAMPGYCKSCGISRAGHTRYIHENRDKSNGYVNYDARFAYINDEYCPNCGQPWENTLCSFTFTMMGHLLTISNFYNIEVAQLRHDPLYKPLEVVVNEYDLPFTAVSFLDTIIRVCPVQFQDYGRWS